MMHWIYEFYNQWPLNNLKGKQERVRKSTCAQNDQEILKGKIQSTNISGNAQINELFITCKVN